MDALQQLNLAAPIAATYNEVEEMLLCHIAEQLAANPDTLINATSEWRIKMLAQMGRLNQDTARIIAAKVGKVPEQVEQVVSTAIDSVLTANGLTATKELSGNIAGALENYNRQAVISKYNQVNTVMQYKAKQAFVNGVNGVADRFDRIQQKALDNAQDYLDTLNDNAMAVVLGEKSRTEAVRETVSQMCDKGIPAFVDASGKEWSPEAYVNMDIRNTAKNTAQAAQFSCMDELGQDVILVSSHSGARPLCFPYQGKFYSKSGKSGTIKDARGKEYSYEPLSNTSYGKPAGLFGINCGHRMRGVSEGTFINREKQYDETENGEEYERVCEQRRQERKIRADKTKRDALKAAGDDEGAKALNGRISAENKQLKAYCEENGLSYRQDRTRTYGYSDTSRKKTPEPLIESVDNSGGSGIINSNHKLAEKKAFSFADYDTVINPESVLEFNKSAQEFGFQHINGIEKLTNGETASEILGEIGRLSTEYGKSFSSISITDFVDEKTVAETIAGELRLNSRFMNSPDALHEVLNEWERTNFIPESCNSIKFIGDHEFYHLLTQDIIDRPHSRIATEIRRAHVPPLSQNAKRDLHEYVADLLSAQKTSESQERLKQTILGLIERE